MTVQGAFYILLKAVGVTQEQQNQLLATLQGRLPNTEDELATVCAYIRRMAHMIEHNPISVSAATRGNNRGDRDVQQMYWLEDAPTYAPPPAPAPQAQAYPAYAYPAHASWTDWEYPCSSDQSWTDPWPVYQVDTMAMSDYESDADTDTNTSEDSGRETLDLNAIASLPDNQQTEQVYWAYRTAKKAWRRFSKKGTRKFRRYHKRFSRKSRGKGKGKYSFPTYFGKKGGKSSGKGRKNPKDKFGNVLKCSICQSDEHLRARCPQRQGGSSNFIMWDAPPQVTATASDADAGPLAAILDESTSAATLTALRPTPDELASSGQSWVYMVTEGDNPSPSASTAAASAAPAASSSVAADVEAETAAAAAVPVSPPISRDRRMHQHRLVLKTHG